MSCVSCAQLIDLQIFLGCGFAVELMPREARVVRGLVGTGLDWCANVGRFGLLGGSVLGMVGIVVLSICCLGFALMSNYACQTHACPCPRTIEHQHGLMVFQFSQTNHTCI